MRYSVVFFRVVFFSITLFWIWDFWHFTKLLIQHFTPLTHHFWQPSCCIFVEIRLVSICLLYGLFPLCVWFLNDDDSISSSVPLAHCANVAALFGCVTLSQTSYSVTYLLLIVPYIFHDTWVSLKILSPVRLFYANQGRGQGRRNVVQHLSNMSAASATDLSGTCLLWLTISGFTQPRAYSSPMIRMPTQTVHP